MAKTDSSPPPSPKPAAKPAAKASRVEKPSPSAAPSAGLIAGYQLLKLAGVVVGGPAAQLCLMALIGSVTENGYVRFLGALVAVLGVPLFIADRLLPDHNPTKASGLVTDALALTWMLTAFGVAVAAGATTRPMLVLEGDRLVKSGYEDFARAAYLLAGVTAEIPAAVAPAPSGSASAGPATSASGAAPIVDAGAAAVIVDAGEVKDAGKPAPSGKNEKTPAELFKELAPSVVTVFVKQKHGGEGSGTGFVVDKDGTIATNHHVIAEAAAVRVRFQNGATYEDVEVLVDETAADLALIKINLAAPLEGGVKPDAAPVPLGDSEAIVVGEHAISIGNPLGLEHTLTDGLVSSRRIYEEKAWIQFSAPISPGNSGGPLFDMRGEVIGISTATITGYGVAQNLNLAVPVNELKKLFRPVYSGRHKLGDGSSPSHW